MDNIAFAKIVNLQNEVEEILAKYSGYKTYFAYGKLDLNEKELLTMKEEFKKSCLKNGASPDCLSGIDMKFIKEKPHVFNIMTFLGINLTSKL